MAEIGPTIVIDNGSETCKVGYSGVEAPSSIFPTYVSRRRGYAFIGAGQKQHWVGEEAWRLRGVSRLRRPVEFGYITSFDDMELLWKYVIDDHLHADYNDHPILITEEISNPKFCREKTAEVVFETLEVPAFYLAKQSVLALYASGRTSGIVFSCGHSNSFAVPVYEGFALQHAVSKLDVSGFDLSDYFNKLIAERGYEITTSIEREDSSKRKTEVCYVAQDFSKEIDQMSAPEKLVETPFELPDGKTVCRDKERIMVPEALFDPNQIGLAAPGAPYVLNRSIIRCDAEIRHLLYQNIVPAGGSTKYPGFVDRLHSEMVSLAPSSASINVISSPEPLQSAWVGGSMVASLSTFKDMCISAQEYEEIGPAIVNRKCL